jgi:hypothetical protein
MPKPRPTQAQSLPVTSETLDKIADVRNVQNWRELVALQEQFANESEKWIYPRLRGLRESAPRFASRPPSHCSSEPYLRIGPLLTPEQLGISHQLDEFINGTFAVSVCDELVHNLHSTNDAFSV